VVAAAPADVWREIVDPERTIPRAMTIGMIVVVAVYVLANVAYSTVYVADVFIQLSGFHAKRAAWRRVLLVVGFAFAAILTHFFASGIWRPA